MIIAVDIDNTLNSLTEAVLSVYNEDSGDNLALSDITEYRIEDFVKSEFKNKFYQYFLDKKVWKQIYVQPHCREVLAQLHREGHMIIFVTTTEPENLPKKKNWLIRNFPFIDVRHSLYSCPTKQLIKCDILIDDHIGNLVGDREYYSICIDYAWNRKEWADKEPCFTRVKDWNEIPDRINMIADLLKENEDDCI